MRRNAAAVLMVAALGGCVSYQSGPETGGGGNGPHWGKSFGPPTVPGVKGPFGENVAMAAPYDNAPPANAYLARQMMSQNIPLSAVQMNNPNGAMPGMIPGMPPGGMMSQTAMPRGPMLSPPGIPYGPGVPAGPNVPGGPGMPPGMMPPGMMAAGGVQPANMPMGGGVINANIPPGMMPPGGIMQAQMAQANPANGIHFQGQRTQIRFVRPSGMRVAWFTQGADGKCMYSTNPVEAPGRYNFPQAAIYRLKLSNIESKPGLEVYPTMEVVPCNPKTEAFLAHSAVPIEFTNEDFKQIMEGNYLVKVIYLPDPQNQDVAGTGTDEIISTRLEPGADPIQEALRRGSILVVLRMGNVDQEAPNTPPLNAPSLRAGGPPMNQQAQGFMPAAPGYQVPIWGLKSSMPGAMAGTPKSMTNGVGVSLPRGGVPGTSSTNKYQYAPPPPPSSNFPFDLPPPSPTPQGLPQLDGPVFPPTPGSIQPEGPSLPGIPPQTMGPTPGLLPATVQPAGQTGP